MSKVILRVSFAVLVLLFLGVVALSGWLLATPEGARRLLDTSASAANARLEIGRLDGRFLDGLRLENATLHASGITLRVKALHLDWNPLPLLIGNLSVEMLHARGMEIRDDRPESTEPTDLSWPTLSGPLARLSGRIGSLDVRDVTYRRLNGRPMVFSRISSRIDLRLGRVALTGLSLDSPRGRAEGAAGISFREPYLNLFATVTPSQPAAGFDRILLHCALEAGRGEEHTSGTIRAVAMEKKRRIGLSTGVGLTRTKISLRDLALTEAERGGRLTGKGGISFAGRAPEILLALRAEKLDLSPEIPSLPPVTGSLDVSGSIDRYRGGFRFAATGAGWRTASLQGTVSGSTRRLDVLLDRGAWLNGTLGGSLRADWSDGLSLSAALRGRKLNPARITPDWTGIVNLDLNATLRSTDTSPLSGTVEGRLLDSHLRGRSLSGQVSARLSGSSLLLDRLLLQGKGFDIRASGDLSRDVAFAVRANDLGGLVPGAGGSLLAEGKIRRRDGRIGGSLSGRAMSLKIGSLRSGTASFTADVGDTPGRPLKLLLNAHNLGYGGFTSTETRLDISGAMGRHVILLDISSPPAALKATLEGGYRDSAWQGTITRLSGRDGVGPWNLEKAAALKVSKRGASLLSLVLTGAPGERFEGGGEMNFRPAYGYLNARWQRLNLARFARLNGEGSVTGSSSGNLSLAAPAGSWSRIAANIDFSGTAASGEHRIEVRSGSLRVETAGRELRATADLTTARDGRLRAGCTVPAPAGLSLPQRGTFQADLEGGDFRAIRPWLPAGLSLEGGLAVQASGEWLPPRKLRLRGTATVGKGSIAHQRKGGTLRADVRAASLAWDWRDETLGGSLDLDLADTGRLRGDFRLPLPARLSATITPDGPLSISVSGNVRENGILAALFPGMLQESRGELELEARIGDTWRNPRYGGKLLLSKAAVSLPRAGVRFKDIRVSALLENNSIRVDSFSARSGPGTLTGSALVRLKDWKADSYQGKITGEKFQFLYLPELQVLGSPNIDFTGTTAAITVRGEMGIPELLVTDSRTPPPVRASRDVVVVDAPAKASRSFPLAVDAQVRVKFGDKVFVRAAGIDARLGGNVDLTMRGPDDIRGKGEVRVKKGSYKAYGVNLEITKGRLVFLGGPVSQPNLDILALRTVGEVKAGVILGGTLQSPVIRLYSEPGMTDSDIMGYIVLGRPLSGDRGQANAVMSAAGLLLSAGQSAVLREQITSRFGIDTFGMEQDKTDVTRSLVTVGKYLTPRLFLSYGRSLFSPTQFLRARYTFSERWEVETWTGTESGIDVYYKINFN
jgi:translocation and assembly module TamB